MSVPGHTLATHTTRGKSSGVYPLSDRPLRRVVPVDAKTETVPFDLTRDLTLSDRAFRLWFLLPAEVDDMEACVDGAAAWFGCLSEEIEAEIATLREGGWLA